MLLVGSHGRADGSVKVDELIVEGQIKGNVDARSRIEIHKGGHLLADVATKSLVIEEGGIFHGRSVMGAEGLATCETKIDNKQTIDDAKITTTNKWGKAKTS